MAVPLSTSKCKSQCTCAFAEGCLGSQLVKLLRLQLPKGSFWLLAFTFSSALLILLPHASLPAQHSDQPRCSS